MKKSKKKIDRITVDEVVESYSSSKYDANGSYTGVDNANPNAKPTQDADDL